MLQNALRNWRCGASVTTPALLLLSLVAGPMTNAATAADATNGINNVTLVPVVPGTAILGAAEVAGDPRDIQLSRYDYVEEEFFVSGSADSYTRNERDERIVLQQDIPYTTRVIIRRPRDAARYSGVLVVEPKHPQLASITQWSASADYLMRSGHVFAALGVGTDAQQRNNTRSGVAPTTGEAVAKWFDPVRYKPLAWPEEDGIRWDVTGDLVAVLRGTDAVQLLPGFRTRTVIATGWSFTGSYWRTYINEGFHSASEASARIDAYLIGISSRWNGGGYLPLNSAGTAIPNAHARRELARIDVPVVEFLTANEVASGTGPQVSDRDDRNGGHRLYELGGSNHSDSFHAQWGGARGRPMLLQLAAKGHSGAAASIAAETSCNLAVSDLPIAALSTATLDNLVRWTQTGEAPPRGEQLRLDAAEEFVLDANGNPTGGIPLAEFAVPRASYKAVAAADRPGCAAAASRTAFYRYDFSPSEMQQRYGSVENYVAQYRAHIDELVKQRWLLAPEAAALVAQAESAARDIEARQSVAASFGHYQPAKRYSEQVETSFFLAMRDGVRLAVRLLRPAENGQPAPGRFPVIWQHALTISLDAPDLNGPRAFGYRSVPQLTDYGYVVAQVVRRGNGQSFGVRRGYHPRDEAFDAYEVTEWLASQPWSSGAVGIYGCSNTGDAALHALTSAPPHLKAAFAGCFSWNKYDAMRRGGVFAQWGTGPQRTLEEDMAVEPVAGDESKTLLREAAVEHQQSTVLYDLWKGMPFRDSHSTLVGSRFWAESSVSSYASQIRAANVPLYIQAAWNDEFRDQGLVTLLNVPGSRILIGPWKHCENVGFGLVEEIHRFFDTHLKGIDTGLAEQDPIHYYTVNATDAGGEWRSSGNWPLSAMQHERLHLVDGNGLAATAPNQSLSAQFSVNTAITSCPEAGAGSAIQPCHLTGEGLGFATAPLTAAREVSGEVLVKLRVSVNRDDASIFAFLEDVAPDGSVRIVTEGRQRASLRATTAAPWRMPGTPWQRANAADSQPLTPDTPVDIEFAMLPASYVFLPGHRLQLTVTGADHRERDRMPQSEGAVITLVSATDNYIDLPVIP